MKSIKFILPSLIFVFSLGACSSAPEISRYEKPLPNNAKTDQRCLPKTSVPPAYPLGKLSKGIQGWAYFSFALDGSGQPVNLQRVDQSSDEFAEAAETAMLQFVYDASTIEANCTYLFSFNIRD